MKKLRMFLNEVPLLVAWLIASVIFWGWIFSLLTETVPEKKFTVAVDAVIYDRAAFAAKLEEYLPENLSMVRIYPFDYDMVGSSTVEECDLYIVSASSADTYSGWFTQIPGEVTGGYECGKYGALFSGYSEYIAYLPEEQYYLCSGANSVHPEIASDYMKIMLDSTKGNN